jgi:hypothetical protein
MFLGWAYDQWETDRYGTLTNFGQMRSDFMNSYMLLWVNLGN